MDASKEEIKKPYVVEEGFDAEPTFNQEGDLEVAKEDASDDPEERAAD
jgi:hypothetical protein